MPLPKRKKDESRADFIRRCMGDPVMVKEFPDASQRRAICEKQAEADFNVLGIQMRGYHDFGCALQDPRGGVKMKGEA